MGRDKCTNCGATLDWGEAIFCDDCRMEARKAQAAEKARDEASSEDAGDRDEAV